MYYRESFEYSPIKLFFNSNSADSIVSRGDVAFNLTRYINLPNNVIGYVSLNELTIPNTDYNMQVIIHLFYKIMLVYHKHSLYKLVIIQYQHL